MIAQWNAATGAAIGADWLLAAIAPASDFGRRVRATERTFRLGDEAAAFAAIVRVDAVARDLGDARLAAVRDALCQAPDVGVAIARAAAGGVLDDVDFFEFGRFADALADIVARCAGTALAGTVDAVPPDVAAALAPGRGPGGSFYLADAYDAGLARAREAAVIARARYDGARGRAVALVTAALGEAVRDGAFVLARDRAPHPLPPGVRVVREARTYLACEFVADDATLAARDVVDRAEAAVAACEEAVRERLSQAVARAAVALARACVALGELDSLVARARFACRYDAVVPAIARAATASFADARYLPIATAAAATERAYVPIDLDLAGVGVVTGPNMGGKTAALRTLGLLVACVAVGVPVPARAATLPLVDEIVWLGIGIAPDDVASLSAFGTEAVDLRDFLRRGAARPLVLMDEFARTTSPREGRALLVATIARLRERGALGLAATHLDGVARASGAPHFASGGVRTLAGGDAADDLATALARIARATDFRLHPVDESAGPPSGALALAEALGLDAALVSRARDALPERD